MNGDKLYTVTYVQEMTQIVRSRSIQDAAAYVHDYARKHNMKTLSIYEGTPPRDVLPGKPVA